MSYTRPDRRPELSRRNEIPVSSPASGSDRKQLVAVIDIGSGSIRMVIGEVDPDRDIRYLESLQRHVPLGKDVFSTGRIRPTTQREAVRVLENYKQLMSEYGLSTCYAIATAAVREASNRDNFVDKVFVRTGIEVEVIEGAEENRLEMIAVTHGLDEQFDFHNGSCLILEVGSGSTVLIFLDHGEIEATRTLTVGSVRLPEGGVLGETDPKSMRQAVKRVVHASAEYVARDHGLDQLDQFIAVGSEMRFAARQLRPEAKESSHISIPAEEFVEFVRAIGKLSTEEIADRYDMVFAAAETVYPALLYYRYFATETKCESILVAMTSMRDGLVIEQADILSGNPGTDVSRLVRSSAKRLGAKYDYDEPHALWIAHLATRLFDEFRADHGLEARDRLLIEIAAILHEIGMYISPSGRHKHSAYLIMASDIFGLRESDRELIANVARYHRGALPRPTHETYWRLSKRERAKVAKLASLLRIAIALDVGRTQRIREIQVDRSKEPYEIWVPMEAGDLSLERDTLKRRKRMFTEFFGVDVVLKQGKPVASLDA